MKYFLRIKKSRFSAIIVKSDTITKTITTIQKLIILFLVMLILPDLAKALPSYARQTGMSCTSCHYSFPELNSFGRQFKINGYTMTFMKTIEVKEDSSEVTRLNLLSFLPLSVMLQSSFTHINKDVIGKQNNSGTLPQQLSLFFAGEVTPRIGTFIQMTYNGHSFGMDNADIRYTNQTSIGTKSLVYGLTLNNNPAVQDIWNTSPAWRFPSATSDAAVNPAKSALIERLGEQVAGMGVYTLYNNLLFAELSLYRSVQQGAANPPDSTSTFATKGASPYWRFALQHQWENSYVELGTFGIASRQYFNGISGPMDNFTDVGFDFQYERNLSVGSFTMHTSLINEKETRDTSSTQHAKLNFSTFKIDGNLYLKNGMGATIGYFTKSGSVDPQVGSFTNKPNSDGFIFQLEYLRWLNTKFTIQYVVYNKFDGSKRNYDGMSRNASNNNTLYLLAWINF